MTWEPGRERVQELIDAGEVDRVMPDPQIARRMLEDAARHLATVSAAKQAGDLSGGYQVAYDALRKSAASLLEAQGLRATSRGQRRPVVRPAGFRAAPIRPGRAVRAGAGRYGKILACAGSRRTAGDDQRREDR